MQHWRSGLLELFYDTFPGAQLKMLQSYIPSLRAEHFSTRKESGIRAMALQPDGTMVDDFLLHLDEARGHLHVRNAPSPAATASLAIAEEIVDRMSTVLRNTAEQGEAGERQARRGK
jgi:L-2-hydroxyglutarate oxidase LhgO